MAPNHPTPTKIILAFCDSLCEPNPGDMHVGCWAKNERNEVLFAKHKRIGYGTCNEAEYHALFSIVAMLEEHFLGNWPTVVIHSDSQLMTKQVTGQWNTTKPEIIALYNKAMALQAKFGFTVKWIPRENNAVADALAQEERLKGSGRRFTMEDGRFRVHRNTPCVEIFTDKEMGKMLHTARMSELKVQLETELERERLDFPSLLETLESLQQESTKIHSGLPKLNGLIQEWVESTFHMLSGHLETFITLAKNKDDAVNPAVQEFLSAMKEKESLHIKNESGSEVEGVKYESAYA